jgi:hypothetical protein
MGFMFWLGLLLFARDNRKGQSEIAGALYEIAEELRKSREASN